MIYSPRGNSLAVGDHLAGRRSTRMATGTLDRRLRSTVRRQNSRSFLTAVFSGQATRSSPSVSTWAAMRTRLILIGSATSFRELKTQRKRADGLGRILLQVWGSLL